MKKVMLVLFTAAIATVSVNAQTTQPSQTAQSVHGEQKARKTPEERTEMAINRMDKTVTLTDDQKAKMKDAMLKHEKERETLQANRQKTNEDFKAENKKIRDDADADIKKILTPEQYQKWEQQKAEMKQKHQEMRKAGKNHKQPSPAKDGN